MKLCILVLAAATMLAAPYSADAKEAKKKMLSDNPIPAEHPPEWYIGREYVDSEGCVFIRAGTEGSIVWVPRVTRARELMCGYDPTFPDLVGAQ